MADEKRDQEETERKDPAVLPAREAMSIIAPTTGGGFPPDLSSVPSAEESVSSEDRSDEFESHDSAESET